MATPKNPFKLANYKRMSDLNPGAIPEVVVDGGKTTKRYTDNTITPTVSINPGVGVVKDVKFASNYVSPKSGGFSPDWNKIGSVAEGLAPFASNIVNSMRRAPRPNVPKLNSPVTLRGVDYSADRAEMERITRGADMAADRALDGNTSTAVRSSNLSSKLMGMSRINQAESNANAEIGNRQSMINAQIDAGNNAKLDAYGQQGVEREIAQQRASSENISNAADKFVSIGNEKAKRELDLKKAAWIKEIYRNTGVLKRAQPRVDKALQEEEDPYAMKYGGRVPKVSLTKRTF